MLIFKIKFFHIAVELFFNSLKVSISLNLYNSYCYKITALVFSMVSHYKKEIKNES